MDWVGAVILAVVPIAVYVAWRYVRAAMERPHIDFLSTSAVREATVAGAMVLLGVIGANVLYRGMTGSLFLPPGVAVGLLALAVLLIAAGSVIKFVALLRWDRQGRRGGRRHSDVEIVRDKVGEVRE